jgi:hypothetical protein
MHFLHDMSIHMCLPEPCNPTPPRTLRYNNVRLPTCVLWMDSFYYFPASNLSMPIPVAARSKAWVYGRSLTRIVGSNLTGGMDVCVVLDVWTIAWNIRWYAGQKGLQQYKWIKGENPGIQKKKIPPGAWMSVLSVVFSGRGLCDRPITRPEESYIMWCVWVWSQNLKNEEALAH